MKTLTKSFVSAIIASGFAMHAQAQVTVNGTLDAAYGSALAVQTINTSYGNNSSSGGLSTGGSELDAAYGVISGANLYLFFAGNFQNNGNRLALFISDGRSGQSTFSYPSGSITHFNGDRFSPGFSATFAMDLNVGSSGSVNASEYLLVGTPSGGGQGAFTLSAGIGSGTPNNLGWAAPITIALNDLNTGGVSGSSSGTAANQTAAAAVTTGYEMAIPLSLLGDPTGDIKVLAMITGSSDTGLSNQFLPGLAVGTGSVSGSSPFDFSLTPNEYFTVVAVPEPSTLVLFGLSGLMALLVVRRRK